MTLVEREVCISCGLPRATASDRARYHGQAPCVCSFCSALCWRPTVSECARVCGLDVLADPRAQLTLAGVA